MEEPNKPSSIAKGTEVIHPKVVQRAGILLGIAGLLGIFLLLRILLLQTVDYNRYQNEVLSQITTESKITASRGKIYDCNGAVLATNVTAYRVFISPSSIATAQIEHNKVGDSVDLAALIAEKLSSVLSVDREFVLKQTTYTKYLDRTVLSGVNEKTADQVREVIEEYGWQQLVYLQATGARYYPYSTLAAHALGFTSTDGEGLYGLEYSYNDLLKGTNGKYVTARDAQGNEMPYGYEEYIAAENGYNLHTTLDLYVQAALEEQLKNAYTESAGQNRAAGIVMNVNTGEILAMATYPSFDLNAPRELNEASEAKLAGSGFGAGTDDYNTYRQELLLEQWSNKAITESYIPGSTFKVITGSMALEEDAVSLDETLTCTGSKVVLGQTIHCHKTNGHGTLTFVEGIQQSCNPWLMTVGLRLGTSTFYKYLKAFGFLEKTGIDLPGEGNSVISNEKNFTDLDLAIYAFGQNFNVTLIQQITAIAAVANGGYLVTPHMVSSVTDDSGTVIRKFDNSIRRQVVSEEVCQTMATILEEGVSGNGGAKNAYVAGYRVAAKTGTSEKKNAGSVGKYVCSTVAFAPAEDAQYAAIIIVDEPTKGNLYGSTVAAPYISNLLGTILPYLGVEAVYTEEELNRLAVEVPDCRYQLVEAASRKCQDLGLTVELVGEGSVVQKQWPQANTVIEKENGKVLLYLSESATESQVTVPNVVGMSAANANQALINAGLNVRIAGCRNYDVGTGAVAVAQSIQADTQVARGSVVEVTFRFQNDED